MSSYTYQDEPEAPRITPAVQWLIAANVAIYFLQLTVVQPSVMQDVLGVERGDLPKNLWKALTYMFVHGGFLHLAFNMYTLWLFGPRVEHSWTTGRFAAFYIVCGLGAWLTHAAFFPTGQLIGASGAIYGVMYAFARQWPDEEVYLFFAIPVKVKVLVFLLAGFNLLMAMSSGGGEGGTAYLAHLGGFAAAFFYLKAPSAQHLDRLRQRVAQIPDIPDEAPRAVPRPLPRQREKLPEADEVVAKSNAVVTKRPPVAAAVNKVIPKKSDELNLILDKISEHGLASLTMDERRQLEELSRQLRNR
jgi:membrane associated rhomboid family serine protease